MIQKTKINEEECTILKYVNYYYYFSVFKFKWIFSFVIIFHTIYLNINQYIIVITLKII